MRFLFSFFFKERFFLRYKGFKKNHLSRKERFNNLLFDKISINKFKSLTFEFPTLHEISLNLLKKNISYSGLKIEVKAYAQDQSSFYLKNGFKSSIIVPKLDVSIYDELYYLKSNNLLTFLDLKCLNFKSKYFYFFRGNWRLIRRNFKKLLKKKKKSNLYLKDIDSKLEFIHANLVNVLKLGFSLFFESIGSRSPFKQDFSFKESIYFLKKDFFFLEKQNNRSFQKLDPIFLTYPEEPAQIIFFAFSRFSFFRRIRFKRRIMKRKRIRQFFFIRKKSRTVAFLRDGRLGLWSF